MEHLSRLPIGQPFDDLQDRDQSQSPGSLGWSVPGRKQIGKILSYVDVYCAQSTGASASQGAAG
ncbi:MAG: hypothetical protein H0U76_01035 [Ktedonobacteraceae bacterium]|nr:hypothetical protein [Ktedonobacteraceae bacterium]